MEGIAEMKDHFFESSVHVVMTAQQNSYSSYITLGT